MIIGHLSKPWLPIPPKGYGGLERIVYDLVQEQSRTESVVLFAPASSEAGSQVRIYSLFIEGQADKSLDRNIEAAQAAHCAQHCLNDEIDIIHIHSVDSFLGMSRFIKTPCIFTFHSNPTVEGRTLASLACPSCAFTFLSEYHRAQFPWIDRGLVTYPGVDLARHPLFNKKHEYLVYVGRICAQKGVLDAVQIARRAGLPIKIAGKPRPADSSYFSMVMEAVQNYRFAEFMGEVADEERNRIVGESAGLLFPLQSGEAFGLVQIEAMAVGTPVLAYDVGAASEIVISGRTGYIVRNIDDAVAAVWMLGRIDPMDCRRHVQDNFSSRKMAGVFLDIYRRHISQ